MARAQKANTQSSRVKVITIGDVISRKMTLRESGATVIFTTAASAERSIILPAVANVRGAKGAYFRFVFGVADDTADTIFMTSAGAGLSAGEELFKGRPIYYNSGGAEHTDDMTEQAAGQFADGSDDVELTINTNIEPGTMIDFTTDGDHWYVTGHVIATAVQEFS